MLLSALAIKKKKKKLVYKGPSLIIFRGKLLSDYLKNAFCMTLTAQRRVRNTAPAYGIVSAQTSSYAVYLFENTVAEIWVRVSSETQRSTSFRKEALSCFFTFFLRNLKYRMHSFKKRKKNPSKAYLRLLESKFQFWDIKKKKNWDSKSKQWVGLWCG